MNREKLQGAVDQAKGAIKEAVGKATGDTKLQAEGTVDKLTGKVECAVGDAKAAVGEMLGKIVK
ncbi:MAG: CsbD family protein [Pseudomonadota bacterium]